MLNKYGDCFTAKVRKNFLFLGRNKATLAKPFISIILAIIIIH